jgi:hypothetical protein
MYLSQNWGNAWKTAPFFQLLGNMYFKTLHLNLYSSFLCCIFCGSIMSEFVQFFVLYMSVRNLDIRWGGFQITAQKLCWVCQVKENQYFFS